MSLLVEVKAFLVAEVPDTGKITRGFMPGSPDACMALYETGGTALGNDSNVNTGFAVPGVQYETPGLQIVVRGVKHDYDVPRARIEAAYQKLAEVQATTLSGTFYLFIRAQQPPFFMERDENERVKFAVNFLCEKEPSA